MNNREILNNAIKKAENNGFNLLKWYGRVCEITVKDKEEAIMFVLSHISLVIGLVFNHEFAKAFWGDEEICTICKSEVVKDYYGEFCLGGMWHPILPSWQFHLQQMVLEKEPLKYLEKFLEV